MGLPDKKAGVQEMDEESAFKELLKLQHHELDDLNARQAFSIIKMNEGDTVMPTPYRCYREAPDDINVYTDGSWLLPLKQFLGLGGAGVWWPKRVISTPSEGSDCHKIPLSSAEAEIAQYRQHSGGAMSFGALASLCGEVIDKPHATLMLKKTI